jgi:hypothetical protein
VADAVTVMKRLLAIILATCVLAAGEKPKDPNDLVLAAAKSFPDGGGYNWTACNSGAPEAITFKGETILKKGDGSYCCGFTFAVVMRAANEAGLLDDKSAADARKLQKAFYGIGKKFEEKQCVAGLEALGIGHEVKPQDAKAGDFMQLYRTKSGHSVVFLKWIERSGKTVGFTYRSSQKSTNGIGERSEYFKDSGMEHADVDPKRIYFGRLGAAK